MIYLPFIDYNLLVIVIKGPYKPKSTVNGNNIVKPYEIGMRTTRNYGLTADDFNRTSM